MSVDRRPKRAGEARTDNSHVGSIPGDRDPKPPTRARPAGLSSTAKGWLCVDRHLAPPRRILIAIACAGLGLTKLMTFFERVVERSSRLLLRSRGMRPEASAARPGTTPLTREAGEVENAAGKLAAGPASTDRGRRRQRLRCKTLFALRPGRPAPMHRRRPHSRLCDRRRSEPSRRSESPATIPCRAQ